jgi:hypothetical protein
MKVIKAPEYFDKDSRLIFLGGSIDMGQAEPWQDWLTKELSALIYPIVILNPRRDDWDSSWEQDPTPGTKFHEQVTWELEAQEWSGIRVYYFADDSRSPITLMELGLSVYGWGKTIVYCSPKFYRYGNVKVVCDRYDGVELRETKAGFLALLKETISNEYE